MVDLDNGPLLEDYSEYIDEQRLAWMLGKRDEICAWLEGEVGPQQKGSPQVFGYWREVLPPEWSDARVREYAEEADWCGGLILAALHNCGVATDVFWIDGTGFVGPCKLPMTRAPKRADIAYFNTPYRHYAGVLSTDLGKLVSIDGNQIKGVTKNTRPLPPWGHEVKGQCVFFSIQPLLLKALDAT